MVERYVLHLFELAKKFAALIECLQLFQGQFLLVVLCYFVDHGEVAGLGQVGALQGVEHGELLSIEHLLRVERLPKCWDLPALCGVACCIRLLLGLLAEEVAEHVVVAWLLLLRLPIESVVNVDQSNFELVEVLQILSQLPEIPTDVLEVQLSNLRQLHVLEVFL